jgi:two-component system, cell cycle sensor histidine kinase DivJ
MADPEWVCLELANRVVMERKNSNISSQRPGVVNLDWWNAAWLAALALCAGILLVTNVGVTGAALLALVAMAMPPILSLALAGRSSDLVEPLQIWVWGISAVAAVLLVGGVGGPLAAWLLCPLAAASVMASPRRLALGAAIALGSLGAALLGGWILLLPPAPAPALSQSLGVAALVTSCLGIGAGLIMLQRRLELDRRRTDRSQAQMRQALAEQPHILVAVDRLGHLNAVWGQVRGDLLEALSPRRRLSAIARVEDRPNLEAALAKTFETGTAETRFGLFGTETLGLSLSLRRVSKDRVVGAISDARDQIARENALEQAKAEAEAQNAGKSRFLANMSHELRTPLNAIMGFADIMKQRLFGPIPDRYSDYPELIHESGAHLLELINDVLDMSKIEADRYELNLEEFDVREALNATIRLMRGQADRVGVNLRGVAPEQPLDVFADRRAIKQISLNLISNALRFTPRGGLVTISVSAAGSNLELSVVDTGAGIAPADLERLGKPYEQAGDTVQRSGGTGLGLSLVRALAELHGGRLLIESQEGQGAKVSVIMPVVRPRLVSLSTADLKEGTPSGEVSDLNIDSAHNVALK